MANGWSLEQRARQSNLIQSLGPWEQSTGQCTDEARARVSRNGYKGGVWREVRNVTRYVNAALRDHRAATQRGRGSLGDSDSVGEL